MTRSRMVLGLSALVLFAGTSAGARSDTPPAAPATPTPAALAAPDPALDALTKLVVGNYVGQNRVLRIAEVRVTGAPRMMLAEICNNSDPAKPEAHVLLQFIRRQGEVYLRQYRLPGGGTLAPGLWAAPDAFPDADGSRLDILTDMPVETDSPESPTRIRAATPGPVPTLTAGAVEMTSEIVLGDSGLTLFEKGFDADGKELWQFPKGEPGAFARSKEAVRGLEKRPSGLFVHTLVDAPEGAKTGQPLDEFTVHYTGWLPNGFVFDTTRQQGRQPFQVTIPGAVIQGWNEGLIGMKVGETRRLIVPPALGWGDRGSGNVIPPNSWVVFDIEVVDLKKSDAPAEPGAATAKPAPVKPAENPAAAPATP